MARKHRPSQADAPPQIPATSGHDGYGQLVSGIADVLDASRRAVARTTNSVLVATYWEVGRRIVEFEQGGEARAEYGGKLLPRLGRDLTRSHGRGFSTPNLYKMRTFYLDHPILSSPTIELQLSETASVTPPVLPLSWTHYVHLMAVRDPAARALYESEALRSGWSVRQLDRQISTQFFERVKGSADPERLLAAARRPEPADPDAVRRQIRDPYLLEFLDLKDEYSESDLEEAIIRHLESFLLELGAGFAFVARQKRLRVGDEWYRIDLLLYHRALRCLVVVDLKLGRFTHADAGQMNLYLNYAREHLTGPGENDPVGLVLCSAKDDAVVHYAMGGINAQVFAAHYLTALPDAETLRREILATRRAFLARGR